jgi:hypothetical protein
VGSLEKRLERLEAATGETSSPPERPNLVTHVLDIIEVHRQGRSVYPATDTEINVIGGLVAFNKLPDKAGAYTFPSGATITFTGPSSRGTYQAYITGRVEVEDLPEGLREYIRRMDPAKQPERERRLYELLKDGDGT